MRLLVKIGGAALEDDHARQQLACSIATARESGHEIIVVHGGGNQIRELTGRLGIESRYHDGLRITDAETAQAVVMVLGGLVNRLLVASLESAGVGAVGLTGADGSTFRAARYSPDGKDLGFVGSVHTSSSDLVDLLLGQGYTPVLATVAPLADDEQGDRSHFYNINADMGAGPLARALGATTLLFLTDVPGVLDHAGAILPRITPEQCESLKQDGVIHGGMIPKVDAALSALEQNPDAQVKIAPAGGATSVLDGLDPEVGTLFCLDGGALDG